MLAYLRRHVMEAMLRPSFGSTSPTDPAPRSYGIDLTSVHMGSLEQGYQPDSSLVTAISRELEALGWNTATGYGGSTLFVFPTGERPAEVLAVSGFE